MTQMQDFSPDIFKKKLLPHCQILGIDFGVKRIGLSISDMLWLSASPIGNVSSVRELIEKIKDRQIGGIIIGMPLLMNGTEGEQAQIVRKFAEKLYEKMPIPILFWDERLTSRAVSSIMIKQADLSRKRQKQIIDSNSAVLILQNALDRLSLLP